MLRRAALLSGGTLTALYAATDEHDRQAAQRAAAAAATTAQLVLAYRRLGAHPGTDTAAEVQDQYSAAQLVTHEACAQRVLRLCRTCGGMFIKLGQYGSSLRPALPEPYLQALSTLQDHAPVRAAHELLIRADRRTRCLRCGRRSAVSSVWDRL